MDKVSGRKPPSLALTHSDPHGNSIQCDKCSELGKVVCAAGFCQKCDHFLCKSCIDQHNKWEFSERHEITKGKTIRKQKSDTSDVEKCATHSDRPIEAYCDDHDKFGCSLCLLVGHRSCQKVSPVSYLSRGVESSKKFQDVQKASGRYKTLQDEYKQAITKYLSMNDECYTKTLEGFQQFRSEIQSIVKDIGEKVHKDAEKIKAENERQLKSLEEQINKYSEKVKNNMLKMDDRRERNNQEQLFIALKTNGKCVVECVQRLEILHKNVYIKTFGFHFDPTFKEGLIKTSNVNAETTQFSLRCTNYADKDKKTSDQTETSPSNPCISASQVSIKSPEDYDDCWVPGMIELSATQLILTDYYNSCLKILDTTSETIRRRRVLTDKPWDITSVSGNRLAASFPSSQQIMFFTADQNLNPCESISVPGCCYGLHYTADKLIVSYNSPAKVQILDLTGTVLKTLQHYPSGKDLFRDPLYLTFSYKSQLIYVSDFIEGSLTCMTTTGVVQWVYQDQDLKAPTGLITGDIGCLYICSSNTDTIHVVSAAGVRLALIPPSDSGVRSPRALCYSSHYQTLYVSFGTSDPQQLNYIKRLSLQ